jgi:hypothetical protein
MATKEAGLGTPRVERGRVEPSRALFLEADETRCNAHGLSGTVSTCGRQATSTDFIFIRQTLFFSDQRTPFPALLLSCGAPKTNDRQKIRSFKHHRFPSRHAAGRRPFRLEGCA